MLTPIAEAENTHMHNLLPFCFRVVLKIWKEKRHHFANFLAKKKKGTKSFQAKE